LAVVVAGMTLATLGTLAGQAAVVVATAVRVVLELRARDLMAAAGMATAVGAGEVRVPMAPMPLAQGVLVVVMAPHPASQVFP
jgi:hypothetical protein